MTPSGTTHRLLGDMAMFLADSGHKDGDTTQGACGGISPTAPKFALLLEKVLADQAETLTWEKAPGGEEEHPPCLGKGLPVRTAGDSPAWPQEGPSPQHSPTVSP